MNEFTEYLAKLDEEQAEHLGTVLTNIAEKFPNLDRVIKFNQPMFTDHGTFILGLSASKKHFSVAPEAKVIELFKDEAESYGYETTQQLIKIKYTQKVNYDFIYKLIEFNIEDKKDYTKFWR